MPWATRFGYVRSVSRFTVLTATKAKVHCVNAKPPTPGSQSSLRESNRARIIDAIKQFGGLTQVELAGATGLSAATVSNIVKELTALGVLNTTQSIRSGRRAQHVTLARTPGLVGAVQFGLRHMRVALADTSGSLLSDHRLPLGTDHRADAGLDRAALLIADMLETVDASSSELLGVGLALPAPVDMSTGLISSPGIMRGWDNVPVMDVMSQRINKPVAVANASNMGALGELKHGAAMGARHVLYIQSGLRIGAGLILNSQIFWGANGSAGEFGHMTVNPDGAICRCGNRGCLETEAGAAVLLDSLRGSHGVLTLKDMLRLAAEGDLGCIRVISDAGRKIGMAAANLCNVFNPERVILGGDLADAGEVLLGPVREAIERFSLPSVAESIRVEKGSLGADAELLGVAAFALERFVEDGSILMGSGSASALSPIPSPVPTHLEDQ